MSNEVQVYQPQPENQKKQMSDADKKRRKKILTNIGFLLLNVIVVVVLFYSEKSESGSVTKLNDLWQVLSANRLAALLAVGMFGGQVLSETIVFGILIAKSGYGFRPLTALKCALLGKYYDYVTPFATGGQPFQMHFLAKSGIEKGQAYSIPLSKHTVRRIAVNFAILIIYSTVQTDTSVAIKVAAYLSLAISLTLPASMLFFSFNPKLGQRFTLWFVKMGHKLKLVKDYDKAVKRISDLTSDFLISVKHLSTNPVSLVFISIFSITEVLCYVSVPYFVLRAFGVDAIDYLQSITKGLFTMNAGIYVPTPGSSGGAEALFSWTFGDIQMGNGLFFWAVIAWRSLTYYLFLIIGIGINFFDTIRNIIAAKRKNPNESIMDIIDEQEDLDGIRESVNTEKEDVLVYDERTLSYLAILYEAKQEIDEDFEAFSARLQSLRLNRILKKIDHTSHTNVDDLDDEGDDEEN